jgi:hypothetical protein
MEFLITLSPGLAFLTFAGALRWAFRRWFDALPLAVLALAQLLVLLRFGPELFAGKAPLPVHLLAETWPFAGSVAAGTAGNAIQADLLFEVAPLRHLVREDLQGGRWPLWNSHSGTGMPLLGNPQAQVFEPTALASGLWRVPGGLGLLASLRLLLAFTFVFALGRRLGLSSTASSFGALTFAFGGYLSLWLGWPLAAVAVWMPGVLYGTLLVAGRGRGCDFVLASICTAALLMAGHPETILYALVACIAFAGRLVALDVDPRRALGRLAATAALGFALASPSVLAATEYLPQSHRQELLSRRNQRGAEKGAASGLPSFRELASRSARQVLPLFVPLALGQDRTGTFAGPPIGDRPGSGFPGTIALVLVLAGLALKEERSGNERFFALAAAVALVVIAKPPGLPPFLAETPVLSSLPSQWTRISLVFNLAIALAAAHALERWLRRQSSSRTGALVAAGLAIAFGAVAAFSRSPGPVEAGSLSIQALLAALSGLVLLSSPSTAKAAVLAVLAALELTQTFGADFARMPSGQGIPSSELVATLKARAAAEPPFRVAAIGNVWPPNLAALEGLTDLRSSDAAKPWPPQQWLRPLRGDLRPVGDRFDRADVPSLRWLGVRYLLAAPGERFGLPWRRVRRSREGSLYELPNALPLVFLAREGRREPTARGELVWLPFERAEAVVDTVPTRALEADHWAIVSASTTPRLLATTIYDDGNWQALVDGVPAARVRVQNAFVGADLPAGPRRVDLLYRPRSVVLGFTLAAGAWAGLFALGFGRPRSAFPPA